MRVSHLLAVFLVLLPLIVARTSRLPPIDTVDLARPDTFHPQARDVDPVTPPKFTTSIPHVQPATSTPSPVATSAPVTPPASLPMAPSSSWAIRYLPPSYVVTRNVSESGIAHQLVFPITDVTAKLTSHLSAHDAKHQQKRLDKYVQRLYRRAAAAANASQPTDAAHDDHHDKHKKEHKEKHYGGLSSFYLRHAQCRQCVASNLELLQTTYKADVPSYQPYAVMKWCSNAQSQLPNEVAPSADNPQPLQDWEGVCIPAQSDCPSNTVDLNVLSATTCANDVAVTKQSCALCTMDGYLWSTTKRAVKGADNYDGTCVDSVANLQATHDQVIVSQLDSCPSILQSDRQQQRMMQMSGSFFLFFSFCTGLCAILALRRCCQMRARSKAMRLAAVQSQSRVDLPVAEPVSVSVAVAQPSVSSYPGQVALAREQVREVRHQAVAMQEPLLVSSGLNPPFYPQLSNNPPPYGYYRV